jgi:hypothetical protein
MRARSQCVKDIPILHLTHQSDSAPNPGARAGVEEVTYPISVDRLARFISALRT